MFRLRLAVQILALALVVSACGESTSAPPTGAGETLPGSNVDTAAPSTDGSVTLDTVPVGLDVAVLSVLDGDSLAVEIDGSREEVRLLGINAPESDECFGTEARELMDSLIGDSVRLVTDPAEDRDQFGRLLRFVYADGELVNDVLLRAGAVLALSGDHGLEREFRNSEEVAFEAGRGLWEVGGCGDQGSTLVRILDVAYDPPGRDADNLNGEWVAIGNTGDVGVNVSGWWLRDESSIHRFRFPDGFSLEPDGIVQVRVGCGDDVPGELFWCEDGPVWSNGGDTALLMDPNGNVVDRFHYSGDF